MKNIILISLVLIVSCGRDKTKYVENPFDNTNNNDRLNSLENKVAALEISIHSGVTTMNTLNDSIRALETDLDNLNTEIDQSNAEDEAALEQLIENKTVEYNNLLAMIGSLQTQVNTNVSNLAALSSQNAIVEYLDPCGDLANGYDEIILKTNQGDYIAYFEQGGNRFLTKLSKNTLYQTTDSQACRFTINNEGNLV